ncbi:MAG: diguanylate cyclase [Terriglobia bacterium]
MKILYSVLVPGGLLLLAATAFLHLAPPATVNALLPVFPYGVFVAGVLLGWRFDRSRLVFAVIALALAEWALHHIAAGQPADAPTARIVFNAVAFLLPLNFALLSLVPDRGTLTGKGLARLALILLQVPLVALLTRPALAGVAAWLENAFADARFLSWTRVPPPALLAFSAALGLLMARCFLRESPVASGFVWALVAAFLALNGNPQNPQTTIYLATAGLILVIAVVEASYAMAYRDELTRLPARRALTEALAQSGNRYAVAMVDVDHFKKFNDKHGHDVGDQVLRMVGSRLGEVTGGGKAFRYGGEEFALLFPGKSMAEVLPHLELVRAAVESSRFTLRGRDRPRQKPEKPRVSRAARGELSVTVSLGLAEADSQHATPAAVIKAADRALYRAKKAGRNRVKT